MAATGSHEQGYLEFLPGHVGLRFIVAYRALYIVNVMMVLYQSGLMVGDISSENDLQTVRQTLQRFFRRHKLSSNLRGKVDNYLVEQNKQLWGNKVTEKMGQLSTPLQQELRECLFQGFVMEFPVFQQDPLWHFQHELCNAVHMTFRVPNEYIALRGTPTDGLYRLYQGTVSIVECDQEGTAMEIGRYFGTEALFGAAGRKNSPTTVLAHSFCELLYLT
eukprot:CAMPEP_0197688066 /NCGR_PEP_ID=MMETSP1338-20131121/104882_1 /TAXON_ID=43686 ORGANISM="Pelagodinium beii, Strain RCC1491" /NCGR_SAMPLE_ID=MMETSP1338 /ASSEMBLY_ACC=CAM_ASM_000754 /LENGTH=218 /DNA_ID=CAMNT_0043270241 /DNA_START=194 /DNA_END=846 /DNA_ORIENTATION=-